MTIKVAYTTSDGRAFAPEIHLHDDQYDMVGAVTEDGPQDAANLEVSLFAGDLAALLAVASGKIKPKDAKVSLVSIEVQA